MNIEFTKEWCLHMAGLESKVGADIGAGRPIQAAEASIPRETAEVYSMPSSNIAFGRFVQLMRRNKHLALEKLAEDARVDTKELIVIEEDPYHKPDPRTVFQLAKYFGVAVAQLMQIAGLSSSRDPRLSVEAVRFAARSESIADLNDVEREALEAFVAVLSESK
jgi:HTH-type transcriptional regulator, competence development regulator